jgi:hypothetical protein
MQIGAKPPTGVGGVLDITAAIDIATMIDTLCADRGGFQSEAEPPKVR